MKSKMKGRRDRRETEGASRENFYFLFILFFTFFSNSRKSDRRISSGKERKVLYATRATRGYNKHRISPRIQLKIRKNPNF